MAKWYDDLSELPAEHIYAATEALYREGREFPPNGAQIRTKVIELNADIPEWGEVWSRIMRAALRYGSWDVGGAIASLERFHPLAASFARQIGFGAFCETEDPMSVIEGQARRKWELMVDGIRRDAQYQGIPAAGLRTLERVNSEPRQIGDVLREALPTGGGEE